MTRRMIAPLLFGLVGVAILVSLGIWQLRRLEWKTGIIAEIDARLAAGAGRRCRRRPTPERDQYLPGRAPRGRSSPASCTSTPPVPGGAVGYRVIAPLTLADGRRILLDRGFVPIEAKDAARPPGPVDDRGHPELAAGDRPLHGRAGPGEEHLVRPRRAADGRGARDRAGDARRRRRTGARARRGRCR